MRILPIASHEFASMIQRARPPVGWSHTLAVANSGGPDSTCLLFLLNRYVHEARQSQGTAPTRLHPRSIVSLSIDHDLQASSSAMADHAASVAKTLGVKHVTAKLPWGQGMNPPKPGPDDKIEELARDMRQMVLFEQMKRFNANALASGHHADDQVETMFMRLGRGSSQAGLAGMRCCRRWGMGTGGELNDRLYGIAGMRTWMVRPLLEVPKDRILATCEEHGLEYVTDPTNFQPQLTVRNSIRHILSNAGTAIDLGAMGLPSGLARQIADIESAGTDSSVPGLRLASDVSTLRAINRGMIAIRDDIDAKVDDIIRKGRIPSPPGTFLIDAEGLHAIDSPAVREALLYRITRFVSPEPWGSPRAELGRRKDSMQRLQHHLAHIGNNNNTLCVGSGVLWRPVQFRKGRLRTTVQQRNETPVLWLASRQTPYRNAPESLRIDITSRIQEARKANTELRKLEVLFDRRFLVTIHLDQFPDLDPLSTIIVQATEPWFLPEVKLVNDRNSTTIHSHIRPDSNIDNSKKWEIPKPVKSNWITIQTFRPLSAI